MTQEALKLALEAFEAIPEEIEAWIPDKCTDAVIAIKKALAQTEQEPSGHFLDFAYSDSIAYVHVYDQFRKGQQFYKAPPQRTWVGLTDEQMMDAVAEAAYKQADAMLKAREA